MFRNYLVAACNNLLKHKLFSFINIAGLSVGLAACLLIALYVQSEVSYDKHWSQGDRLYRVNTTLDTSGGNPRRTGGTSLLALGALKDYFNGDIEYATRVRATRRELFIGDTRHDDLVVSVDPDIVNMLDFKVLAGDLAATLADPSSIALSEAQALIYFGSENAVGKQLVLARSVNQSQSVREAFRVGAVYRVPGNSVLNLPAMTRLNEATLDAFTFNNWATLDFTTYVQLRPGVDAPVLATRLPDFTNAKVTLSQLNLGADVRPADRVAFDLQSLGSIYLDNTVADSVDGGNKTVVMAFAAIAALVLLIGCLNFTILSTARATQRAREVALRKVVGAGKGQLIAQFLGESFLVVVPAVVLAVMLTELLLPMFETLVSRQLALNYALPSTWLALLSLTVVVSLTGGLYPALVLSWFRPATTLKATAQAESRSSIGVRGALVVFQFSVSIALMIATAVIYLQVEYSARRNPGFGGSHILVLDNLNRRAQVSAVKSTLKQQIAALSNVDALALSGHQPTQTSGYVTMTLQHTLEGSSGNPAAIATMSVDYDFFDTYSMPVVAGRNYDEARDQPTPLFQGAYRPTVTGNSESSVVINASTARLLGFANPQDALGRRLVNTRGFNAALHNFTIIGVVADTQFFSLRSAPRPEIYMLSPQFMTDVLSVRYHGDQQQALDAVAAVWQRVTGGAELSTAFVAQKLNAEFARERIEARMLVSFSLLAILIACMGLYGSAAFTVDRRTKEIGIRKVLGAQVRELVTLLLWQFSKPVLLANVIAWPVALWAMLRWLQRFPYQIDAMVLIPLCMLAGALALSIAWLTVAGNTARVAARNPVYALRYE